MHPDDAVRTLEYDVASTLDADSFSHWEAEMYGESVEYVAENGTTSDVCALLDAIDDEIEDGYRPEPGRIDDIAQRLLDDRPLTDGGE